MNIMKQGNAPAKMNQTEVPPQSRQKLCSTHQLVIYFVSLQSCVEVDFVYFGLSFYHLKTVIVEPQRTYTLLTSTELARCVGCLCTRAGWFKQLEPHRTYTNHTSTARARCVGCLCTSSGGSSTANLHEPHHHSYSKVCRVLLH